MTAPAIHLAFDGGWSDGDPGDGRLRFDSPTLHKASHLYVNARDAQETLLGHLVPTWKPGDVLVVERPGAEKNRVVCWIIGPITHGGSYYKLPILVRTLAGGFASHDEVSLHHYASLPEGVTEPPAWSPPPKAKQQTQRVLGVPNAAGNIPILPLIEPEVVAPIEIAPVAPVAAEPIVRDVVQQIIREVPDPAIAERLSGLERRVTDTEGRLAAAEHNLLHRPVAPAADNEDELPAFLRRDAGKPSQPSPVEQIVEADVLGRLDELEQAVSRLGATVRQIPTPAATDLEVQLRISTHEDRLATLERAAAVPVLPSYRLVEAAHLARNGQELPLRLMAEIGEAMGADWEAAALRIIREHDAATEAEAREYARVLSTSAIGG